MKDPYQSLHVVNAYRYFQPAKEQKFLTFETPNPTILKNERFVQKSFEIESTTALHGLIGFFDCDLYKDIKFSIVPSVRYHEMLSWFPIIFPFTKPFIVQRGNQLKVSLWRKVARTKVWYEWQADVVDKESQFVIYSTEVHNLHGRFYSIGM